MHAVAIGARQVQILFTLWQIMKNKLALTIGDRLTADHGFAVNLARSTTSAPLTGVFPAEEFTTVPVMVPLPASEPPSKGNITTSMSWRSSEYLRRVLENERILHNGIFYAALSLDK